jgi:hypothetical protein
MNDIRYGRKRNGIKRELDKKLKDWLESIDDEEIREASEKDVIVTGGSIASMLLGEKVNDFDLYFRTIETTEKIAKYYVKKFLDYRGKAKKADCVKGNINPVVRRETITNIKGIEEHRIIIYMKSAGVAAENQSTYDYFEGRGEEATQHFADSLSQEQVTDLAEELIKSMESDKPKYRPVFMSQNAITLSNKVQLVTRFYGEPDQIHSNYDFVHATCYYDYNNKELVLPAEALECLLSRTLIYRGSLYPIASIFRMKKFIERGWRITAGEQLKIMWQISELNLQDFVILREQLTGVDMAYMWQLTEALKEVDKDKINSTYVAAIIDKIFD